MIKSKFLISIFSMGVIGAVGVGLHYLNKTIEIPSPEQHEDPNNRSENDLPKLPEYADVKLEGYSISERYQMSNEIPWIDGEEVKIE